MSEQTPIPPSSRAGTPLSRAMSGMSIASPGVGGAKKGAIYERNLHRKRGEASKGAMAYLFCEAIQYMHKQAKGISDLEERLNKLGYHVGLRMVELAALREGKNAKRETKVLGVLQFVHTNVWRTLFGKPADALEKSTENTTQYMLVDNDPLITQFISVPKDMSQLNCAAFAAGVIEGVLDSAMFTAKVTAHSMPTTQAPDRTVFLVQFEPQVVARG